MEPHMKHYIEHTYFIRGNIFKCPKTDDKYNPIEESILQNAFLTQLDYTKIFNRYKDVEDAFLFLDPPYLFSDNSSYASQVRETDMTQIMVDILEFIKVCKCKVMLVINKLNILEYLFDGYEIFKYYYKRCRILYETTENATYYRLSLVLQQLITKYKNVIKSIMHI